MARAYRVPIEQLAARLPGLHKHLKYCCPAITVSPEQAMITPLRSAANCSPATRPGASLPTAPSAGDAGTVLTCLNCHLCGNHHAGLAGLTMDRQKPTPPSTPRAERLNLHPAPFDPGVPTNAAVPDRDRYAG